MPFVNRYLELILTAAGLAVIFIGTAFSDRLNMSPWQAAAISATLVGVLHGLIFWAVRNRQRNVRLQTIAQIRSMLQDVINNELTIIQSVEYLRQTDPSQIDAADEQITRSVGGISKALNHLSEESVRNWQEKYAESERSYQRIKNPERSPSADGPA